MRIRLVQRMLEVLIVLGVVGVLLVLVMPTSMGKARDDASLPETGATGPAGLAAAGAFRTVGTTTTATTTPPTTTTSSTTTSTTSTSTTSTTLPLFTGQRPLRVLAVGDSLMTFPGYALVDQATVYSGLRVESVTKQSSGLVRPDYYDWPKALGRAVREFRPHVVVILLGANDMQPVLHEGHSAALFSENWSAEYAERVERFIQIATQGGASVIWVGLPIMRDPRFSKTEHRLNEFYAAGCAAHPGAFFIDGYALFADANGAYAAKLADASGVIHAMRARDGIHFTMDGARRIAEAVVEVLLKSYRLEKAPVEQPSVPVQPAQPARRKRVRGFWEGPVPRRSPRRAGPGWCRRDGMLDFRLARSAQALRAGAPPFAVQLSARRDDPG